MPGSVSSLQSRGCHALIRTGQAKLAETAQDVIDDVLPTLRDWYGGSSEALPAEAMLQAPRADPDENGRHLLALMGWDISIVDDLLAHAGLPADQVLTTLSELEIAGWIGAVPGGYQRLSP